MSVDETKAIIRKGIHAAEHGIQTLVIAAVGVALAARSIAQKIKKSREGKINDD